MTDDKKASAKLNEKILDLEAMLEVLLKMQSLTIAELQDITYDEARTETFAMLSEVSARIKDENRSNNLPEPGNMVN